jgi:hypothetical protein
VSSETVIRWGLPAWTAAMYPRKTGMDHLGLASVSQDRVLPELSPGINVLTVHPRYWSVYTWLLMEFWDRELPRTNAAWGRFLKPRERIFVAAVMSCPRHGPEIPEVAGKLRVRQEVDQGRAEYDPNAPYLKNSRGGYPIYATAISQLGFTILDRDLPQVSCDAPTPRGRQVGTAMREWMSSTAYYESYFDNADQLVPADVVEDYAERVCLCRATDGPDYPYLLDAFMHGGSEVEAARRRASLRLVCDVANQTKSDPVEPWGFRQFIYYRSDLDGRKYAPSTPELMATARRWRIYQQRELVAWALNRWLRLTCTWGLANGGDRAPIPVTEALSSAAAVDFTGLASELGVGDPSLTADSPFEDLLAWIRIAASVGEDLDAEWDITASACEEHLLDVVWDLNRCDKVSVAAILSLLVTCCERSSNPVARDRRKRERGDCWSVWLRSGGFGECFGVA